MSNHCTRFFSRVRLLLELRLNVLNYFEVIYLQPQMFLTQFPPGLFEGGAAWGGGGGGGGGAAAESARDL